MPGELAKPSGLGRASHVRGPRLPGSQAVGPNTPGVLATFDCGPA